MPRRERSRAVVVAVALKVVLVGLVVFAMTHLDWARRCGPWVTLGLCVGFGATTALLWEVGEYGAFILDTPESVTAYRDTIGDMKLDLSGALLAGLVAARLARRS